MHRLQLTIVVGLVAVTTSVLQAQTHECVIEDSAFATEDGGCKDLAADLVWSRQTLGLPGCWYWYSASQFCEDTVEGGFTDWRLPTVEELQTANANGAPTHFDYDIAAGNCHHFWSSKKTGNWAWAVCVMANGEAEKSFINPDWDFPSCLLFACVREPTDCGNGTCGADEDECTCPVDCGYPPVSEIDCADGIDDDCDGATDCADADCDGDPACDCGQSGDACDNDADCCSDKCKGNGTCL